MAQPAYRQLTNVTNGTSLVPKLLTATSFYARSKGLLGERSLAEDSALWIQGTELVGCNSIHTFFMRFHIDVVFVDRDLKVLKIYRDLGPWRMTMPISKAFSVFEFPAGALDRMKIEIGDQLHVGN